MSIVFKFSLEGIGNFAINNVFFIYKKKNELLLLKKKLTYIIIHNYMAWLFYFFWTVWKCVSILVKGTQKRNLRCENEGQSKHILKQKKNFCFTFD